VCIRLSSFHVNPSATASLTGSEATGVAGNVTVYAPPIIIIDDTHDGDYKKRKWAEERAINRAKTMLDTVEVWKQSQVLSVLSGLYFKK
jgi:prophage tail gpP-like protein